MYSTFNNASGWQWCWWLKVADDLWILMTKFRCWWHFLNVESTLLMPDANVKRYWGPKWLKLHLKVVTNTFCLQHPSPTLMCNWPLRTFECFLFLRIFAQFLIKTKNWKMWRQKSHFRLYEISKIRRQNFHWFNSRSWTKGPRLYGQTWAVWPWVNKSYCGPDVSGALIRTLNLTN